MYVCMYARIRESARQRVRESSALDQEMSFQVCIVVVIVFFVVFCIVMLNGFHLSFILYRKKSVAFDK